MYLCWDGESFFLLDLVRIILWYWWIIADDKGYEDCSSAVANILSLPGMRWWCQGLNQGAWSRQRGRVTFYKGTANCSVIFLWLWRYHFRFECGKFFLNKYSICSEFLLYLPAGGASMDNSVGNIKAVRKPLSDVKKWTTVDNSFKSLFEKSS